MKATSKQVGGSHYLSSYQPIEYIAEHNLNFFSGNILKYLTRYKKKNGLEDLKKALQYCELAEELKPKSDGRFSKEKAEKYIIANNIQDFNTLFLLSLSLGHYEQIAKKIKAIIEKVSNEQPK